MKLEEENNLSQPARQVILNNSNSRQVVMGKSSGLNSCLVNTVLLSVQLFDEKFYPSEITLFDFLMDSNHEVISFSMLADIQRFWNFEWHIERGLRFCCSSESNPCQNHELSIIESPLAQSTLIELVNKAKSQTFCVSSKSIQNSSANHAHAAHFFQEISHAHYTHIVQQLGPEFWNHKIYDMPDFNVEAPMGTSPFQLLKE